MVFWPLLKLPSSGMLQVMWRANGNVLSADTTSNDQMVMWRGLMNCGYDEEAQELIYHWLWMITKNTADYNGTIPGKYVHP